MKPLNCTQHPDQRINLWCAVCEVVVCVECVLLQHRDHAVIQVDAGVFVQQTNEIRTLLESLSERQETLRTAIQSVAAVTDDLDRAADTVAQAADTAIDTAIQALEARRRALKTSISAIHFEKRRTLDAQNTYLSGCLARFSTGVDFGQRLLEQEDMPRVLQLKKMVDLSLSETNRCVDVNMWLPHQDAVIEFHDIGVQPVVDAALGVGLVSGEKLRERAYVPKWDASRRGNDIVLINNDARCYRVDKRGWGGVLGAQVMSAGKYHFTVQLENVAQNTLIGVAYTDVNLNEGAQRRNVVLRENGEFWVFGEKMGSFVHAQFESGDTIRIEVDMDEKEVIFRKNGAKLCGASNLMFNTRPFVALGNADALVSLL